LANNALQKLKSVGLTNPLEIAWEVVPYSFVVDWMLPIGDAISAIDYDAGLDFLSGSLTQRIDTEYTLVGQTKVPKISMNVRGSGRYFSLVRTVYGGAPGAVLPSFKNPLSYGHMANGLSLLAAAFGRGGNPSVRI
jgi:hypothetical protein